MLMFEYTYELTQHIRFPKLDNHCAQSLTLALSFLVELMDDSGDLGRTKKLLPESRRTVMMQQRSAKYAKRLTNLVRCQWSRMSLKKPKRDRHCSIYLNKNNYFRYKKTARIKFDVSEALQNELLSFLPVAWGLVGIPLLQAELLEQDSQLFNLLMDVEVKGNNPHFRLAFKVIFSRVISVTAGHPKSVREIYLTIQRYSTSYRIIYLQKEHI